MKNEMTTYCGGTIIVSPETREHLRAHPDVWDVLEEAVGRLTLPTDNSFLRIEVDMGRVVGTDMCVPAPMVFSHELILFAKRIGREKPSRVVLDSKGEPTNLVSVIAYWDKDGGLYTLIAAFFGRLAPKEPWSEFQDQGEFQESRKFWNKHALVYDPNTMEEVFESTWKEIMRNPKEFSCLNCGEKITAMILPPGESDWYKCPSCEYSGEIEQFLSSEEELMEEIEREVKEKDGKKQEGGYCHGFRTDYTVYSKEEASDHFNYASSDIFVVVEIYTVDTVSRTMDSETVRFYDTTSGVVFSKERDL